MNNNIISNFSETLFCTFDTHGLTILSANPTWETVLGYTQEQILGQSFLNFIKEPAPSQIETILEKLTMPGNNTYFKTHTERFQGGEVLLDWDIVRVAQDHFQAVAREDKTSVAESSIAIAEVHDHLTGLPNRDRFLDRLQHTLNRSRRRLEFQFAVMYLGLDRFKIVNDSLGHRVGDMLLRGVAESLIDCIRPTDMAARVGGDEFAILLDDIRDASSTLRVVNRIQQQLIVPFHLCGHQVYTNVSIGIAISTEEYYQGDDLVRDANIAMYRAKEQGGAGYVVFDKAMHEKAVQRMELEMDLRRAVKNGEFEAYYQPIVDLRTGHLHGFESLVRWNHPQRGLIPPGLFIPIAEETGMVIAIGRWMLEESCRQMQQWQKDFPEIPPLTISVNLSPKQLLSGNFLIEVDQILRKTGYPPHQLKLEITESVIMENTDHVLELLKQIKERSILLCLDDFGTGYSSLSYLHKLPIDVLKVDRSFVQDIETNQVTQNFVETIINLAHKMGLNVVSEGIELPAQSQILREMTCEYGQGYFYSRPVAQSEAEIFIVKAANRLPIFEITP